MHLFLVITQGIGLAVACGIRPFLPVLLAGALASAGAGVHFGGSDFAFLAAAGFLVAVIVALAAVVAYEHRRPGAFQAGPAGAALAGVAIGLGALEFAGSLAGHHHAAWPGIVGGVACAALAQAVARGVFAGAGRRLDASARGALVVYEDGVSLAAAGLAIAAPPISLAMLAVLATLALRGRRRGERKFAGLRVLR
jgi:hypothetical protein